MSNYINGYSYPIFRIYDSSWAYVAEVSLNLCNSEGLIENIIRYTKQNELLNYSLEQKLIGYKSEYTLNYNEYIGLTNIKNIDSLIKYFDGAYLRPGQSYHIRIIPRADLQERYDEVLCTNDSFELGILRGGINAAGNKGIVLKFMSVNLRSTMNLIDGSLTTSRFSPSEF